MGGEGRYVGKGRGGGGRPCPTGHAGMLDAVTSRPCGADVCQEKREEKCGLFERGLSKGGGPGTNL